MNIEIKNVKHSKFASQETRCFHATIYIDGKKAFGVENDGHGGCDNYYPVKGGNLKNNGSVWDEVKRIDRELGKEVIPFDGDTHTNDAGIERSSTYTLNNSLEIVVGNLVNKWLQDRELKKILRRVSYIVGDGLYQLPAKYKPTPEFLARIKTDWAEKDYTMLSGLSLDDARAKLATINFFGEL